MVRGDGAAGGGDIRGLGLPAEAVDRLRGGMIRQNFLLLGFLLLLLWLPLPFGSVVPWSQHLFQGAAFTGVALLALRRDDLVASHDARWLALALGVLVAVALIGVLQSLPWPYAVARVASPEHVELARFDRAALAGGEVLPPGEPSTVPLSLAPSHSRAVARGWLAVGAVGLVALALGHRRVTRRWLLPVLAGSALFQIVYGGQEWYRRSGRIWAVEVPGDASRLRGTFVNSDHFAFYLELVLPLVFATAWWVIRRQRLGARGEWGLVAVAVPVLLWLTLFAGIAFSGSRAGIVAAAVATVVQGLLLAVGRRGPGGRWRWAPVGVAAVVVGVVVVAALGVQQGFGRWRATSAYELTWNERLLVYRESFDAWTRFPWLGSGLGSFREAFALEQPPELGSTYLHAHNDWLELLVTTGLLGLAVVVSGLILLVTRLGRVLLRAQRSEERAAALGALGALSAAAFHSTLDFGLAMPANAATLVTILFVAAAAPLADPERRARVRSRTGSEGSG